MIGASEPFFRYHFACERAESALHAVSHNGATDFSCDGKADAHDRVQILAITNEQDEPWRGHAQAGVRGNEIRAFLDRD